MSKHLFRHHHKIRCSFKFFMPCVWCSSLFARLHLPPGGPGISRLARLSVLGPFSFNVRGTYYAFQPDSSSSSGLRICIIHLISESDSVVSNSLRPHGLYSPWNSPGQNTGVGSLSLLQGVFPTQGLNPGLPHCRRILYQVSHKESPRILEWVAFEVVIILE